MIACREKMGKGRLESRIFMVVKKIKGSLYYSLNFDFFYLFSPLIFIVLSYISCLVLEKMCKMKDLYIY